MKYNRKNKNLTFIREKNKIRNSREISCYNKIGSELTESYIFDLISYDIVKMSKKYKLNFSVIDIKIDTEASDFCYDLQTVKVRMKAISKINLK